MAHDHHDHAHVPKDFSKLNRAFIIGIVLNLFFVVVEAVCGLIYDSLALLSDAGHNLSDVASLALSLFAFKLLRKKATQTYTYGFRRGTILASFVNAIILIVAVVFIIYEAVIRFFHPQPLEGGMVAIVAMVGIFVNGITAWLFMKDQKTDLNVKGAYLHMLADALVSVGVVIGGVIMMYTHWFWIDSVLSQIIGIVILVGTWSLLTQSIKLSMDGVPENIHPQDLKQAVLNIEGVKDFQHVHIWALSTTENALTAHLEMDEKLSPKEIQSIKEDVRHELEHFDIHHSTLEVYFGKKDFGEEI